MDSNETTPNMETSTNVEQPTVKVEIDGEEKELSLDELKNGYLRQSDYTRKTQELAEQRRQLEEARNSASSKKSEDEPEEVKNAREFLKQEGVITKAELESFQKQQEYERHFDKILSASPEIKRNEKAIRDLQQATGWSFEDVIVKYGFSDSDKLSKAKKAQSSVMGSRVPDDGAKSIKDMTPEEYAQFRKEKGIRDRY